MDSRQRARLKRDVRAELEKERVIAARIAQTVSVHEPEVAYMSQLKAYALAKAIEYLDGRILMGEAMTRQLHWCPHCQGAKMCQHDGECWHCLTCGEQVWP